MTLPLLCLKRLTCGPLWTDASPLKTSTRAWPTAVKNGFFSWVAASRSLSSIRPRSSQRSTKSILRCGVPTAWCDSSSAALSMVEGAKEKSYTKLPPKEEAVITSFCPPTAISWKTKASHPLKALHSHYDWVLISNYNKYMICIKLYIILIESN